MRRPGVFVHSAVSEMRARWLTRSTRPIYHVHVRKTGGTSINFAFCGALGRSGRQTYTQVVAAPKHRLVVDGSVLVGWSRSRLEAGFYHYGWSHLPVHELSLSRQPFMFTCLRDPIDRVLSLYRMLFSYRQNRPYASIELDRQQEWLGGGRFGDFLDLAPRAHLLNQLWMFSPTFDAREAADHVSRMDAVLWTSDLDGQLGPLGARLGLSLQAPHARPGETSVKVDLSDADRARLRRTLDREYRMLDILERRGVIER